MTPYRENGSEASPPPIDLSGLAAIEEQYRKAGKRRDVAWRIAQVISGLGLTVICIAAMYGMIAWQGDVEADCARKGGVYVWHGGGCIEGRRIP